MKYLASPYSNPDSRIRHDRFVRACQATAELMRCGHVVFSPIAHSHPLTDYGLPGDWLFWEKFDREFLTACEAVWILMLPGWRESKGIAAEIEIAKTLGKPIRLLHPDTLELTDRTDA